MQITICHNNVLNLKLMLHLGIHIISKIYNTFIENAENLDIAMPTCNLLEYRDKYSITFASLQNYYRNEIGDAYEDNSSEGKSFKNKTKIWGKSEVRTPQPPKLHTKFKWISTTTTAVATSTTFKNRSCYSIKTFK